jgi:hypothetical protein
MRTRKRKIGELERKFSAAEQALQKNGSIYSEPNETKNCEGDDDLEDKI